VQTTLAGKSPRTQTDSIAGGGLVAPWAFGSPSFSEEREAKRLCESGALGGYPLRAQTIKSFLLLFSKKEGLPFLYCGSTILVNRPSPLITAANAPGAWILNTTIGSLFSRLIEIAAASITPRSRLSTSR